jgi:hypothetical protein
MLTHIRSANVIQSKLQNKLNYTDKCEVTM